jgi:hypothetical protein
LRKICVSPTRISTRGAARGISISNVPAEPRLSMTSRSASAVNVAAPATARTTTSAPSVMMTRALPLV